MGERSTHREDNTAGRVICDDALLSRGFTRIPNVVLKNPDLSIGARITYGALLAYLYPSGEYPGQRAMGEEYGFSERSALSYLKELAEKGYLRVTRHGLGIPNTYEILCPWRQNPDPQNLRVSGAESAGLTRNHCGSLERQDVRVKDSLSDSPAAQLVSAWFSAAGQTKPAARAKATCLNVMNGLLAQGYTVEDVRVGIALAIQRRARGPQLIEHIIGEAIALAAEQAVQATQTARKRAEIAAGEQQATQAYHDAQSALDALTPAARTSIEARARAHMPPGASDRALAGMMAYLLSQEDTAGG